MRMAEPMTEAQRTTALAEDEAKREHHASEVPDRGTYAKAQAIRRIDKKEIVRWPSELDRKHSKDARREQIAATHAALAENEFLAVVANDDSVDPAEAHPPDPRQDKLIDLIATAYADVGASLDGTTIGTLRGLRLFTVPAPSQDFETERALILRRHLETLVRTWRFGKPEWVRVWAIILKDVPTGLVREKETNLVEEVYRSHEEDENSRLNKISSFNEFFSSWSVSLLISLLIFTLVIALM